MPPRPGSRRKRPRIVDGDPLIVPGLLEVPVPCLDAAHSQGCKKTFTDVDHLRMHLESSKRCRRAIAYRAGAESGESEANMVSVEVPVESGQTNLHLSLAQGLPHLSTKLPSSKMPDDAERASQAACAATNARQQSDDNDLCEASASLAGLSFRNDGNDNDDEDSFGQLDCNFPDGSLGGKEVLQRIVKKSVMPNVGLQSLMEPIWNGSTERTKGASEALHKHIRGLVLSHYGKTHASPFAHATEETKQRLYDEAKEDIHDAYRKNVNQITNNMDANLKESMKKGNSTELFDALLQQFTTTSPTDGSDGSFQIVLADINETSRVELTKLIIKSVKGKNAYKNHFCSRGLALAPTRMEQVLTLYEEALGIIVFENVLAATVQAYKNKVNGTDVTVPKRQYTRNGKGSTRDAGSKQRFGWTLTGYSRYTTIFKMVKSLREKEEYNAEVLRIIKASETAESPKRSAVEMYSEASDFEVPEMECLFAV